MNGFFGTRSGDGLGWVYDWGDGTRTTGYFPTLHRYARPGTYQVTLTGYSDRNQVGQARFTVFVPARQFAPVARVELSSTLVGLKQGESASIQIRAFDANQTFLSLAGRRVQFFNLEPAQLQVQLESGGTGLRLTAPRQPDRDARRSTVYVYVDGTEAVQPIN